MSVSRFEELEQRLRELYASGSTENDALSFDDWLITDASGQDGLEYLELTRRRNNDATV